MTRRTKLLRFAAAVAIGLAAAAGFWVERLSPWGRAWQAAKLEVMCNDVPPKLRGAIE